MTDRRHRERAALDRCPQVRRRGSGGQPAVDAELGPGCPRDRAGRLARAKQWAREHEQRRCRLGCELFGPLLLCEDIVQTPVRYAEGHVYVTHGAGFGITLDEAQVRKFRRKA